MPQGPKSLGQLSRVVAYLISRHGDNVRVGGRVVCTIEGDDTGGQYPAIDEHGVILEHVYIDDYGRIVGTKDEGYTPKPTEAPAIAISYGA